MKQMPDPTQRSDYALGLSFHKAIVHIADKSARARMSLLLDLLGNDRSLLAPLRHLVESPKFQELMNAPSEAARAIGRDSLLAELGSWCNRETMERLETFLSGTLGIPFPEEVINSTNPGVPAPNAATPTNSYRDESIQSQEGVESEPKARESSAEREKDDLLSLEERISILREKAHGASLCGKHQEAIEFLTEALRLDPAKASLYMQRASLHAKNQDTGSAIQDFTTVLRLEPGNIDA